MVQPKLFCSVLDIKKLSCLKSSSLTWHMIFWFQINRITLFCATCSFLLVVLLIPQYQEEMEMSISFFYNLDNNLFFALILHGSLPVLHEFCKCYYSCLYLCECKILTVGFQAFAFGSSRKATGYRIPVCIKNYKRRKDKFVLIAHNCQKFKSRFSSKLNMFTLITSYLNFASQYPL